MWSNQYLKKGNHETSTKLYIQERADLSFFAVVHLKQKKPFWSLLCDENLLFFSFYDLNLYITKIHNVFKKW